MNHPIKGRVVTDRSVPVIGWLDRRHVQLHRGFTYTGGCKKIMANKNDFVVFYKLKTKNDTSDGYKYVGQSGSTAMPYTRLYSVHLYWWKTQVSHKTWPSGSPHASKKECRREIHSGFETHEKDTQSPKQEQSVDPQNRPWSNKNV